MAGRRFDAVISRSNREALFNPMVKGKRVHALAKDKRKEIYTIPANDCNEQFSTSEITAAEAVTRICPRNISSRASF